MAPKKGKSFLKGRKVRNLANGRMYVSKSQIVGGERIRKHRLENFDCAKMMKCINANSTPEAIKKRVASFKRFCVRNPDFWHLNKIQMYEDNPHLLEVRREFLIKHRDLLGLASSDPEVAKELAFQLKNCRNGVEVVKYIECQREKTVGVVNYG